MAARQRADLPVVRISGVAAAGGRRTGHNVRARALPVRRARVVRPGRDERRAGASSGRVRQERRQGQGADRRARQAQQQAPVVPDRGRHVRVLARRPAPADGQAGRAQRGGTGTGSDDGHRHHGGGRDYREDREALTRLEKLSNKSRFLI